MRLYEEFGLGFDLGAWSFIGGSSFWIAGVGLSEDSYPVLDAWFFASLRRAFFLRDGLVDGWELVV